MRDDQHATRVTAHRVNTIGNSLQRINIKAAIGFVENCQARLKHCHLQHLIALLLPARKPDIQRPLEHIVIHAHGAGFFAHHTQKTGRVHFVFAASAPDRI